MQINSIHKYSAKRVQHSGRSFASKLEAAVFDYLSLLEKGKTISELKCQPHVFLTKARIEMIPDFSYVQDGALRYGEAKGFCVPIWLVKKKLWTVYGPGPLDIFTGSWQNPKLTETIIPKGE